MRIIITEKQLKNIQEGYNYVPNYDSVQENSDNSAGVPFSTVFVMSYLPKGITDSNEIHNYKENFYNDIIAYNYKTIEDIVEYHVMIFDIDLIDAYDLMLNYDQDSAFYGEIELSDGNIETVCGKLEKNESYINWNRIGDDGDYSENFISPFLDKKECSKNIEDISNYRSIFYKGFEFLIKTI